MFRPFSGYPCAILFSGLLGCVPVSAVAASAPSGLKGKTVTVNFTGTYSWRSGSGGSWQEISKSHTKAFYVSSTGGIFMRTTSSGPRRTGSRDKVKRGNRGGVQWSGRTAVLTGNWGAGGAGRLIVSFSSNYSICSARVLVAKQVGSQSIGKKLITSGRRVEIRSAKYHGVSCSVATGNAFAD
ncbi:MAG: hypothetical protein RLZ98_1484 [Pseudomonadota bacterium]|jgi:hypothetical protein